MGGCLTICCSADKLQPQHNSKCIALLRFFISFLTANPIRLKMTAMEKMEINP